MKNKILISKEEIALKISEIAKKLDHDFQGKDLVIVSILKGAICLVSDLIRKMQTPLHLEFISASSYGQGGTKRRELIVKISEQLDLKNRDVLLVDDIYDSGVTLSRVCEQLECKSLKTLVLLKKKVKHTGKIIPDYVLFDIDDHFVVGYGLDYKEHYRGLPDIHVIEE